MFRSLIHSYFSVALLCCLFFWLFGYLSTLTPIFNYLTERSSHLCRSEERKDHTLHTLTENQDAVEYVKLQVWESYNQLPNGTTEYTAETWLATPGVNWFIAKAIMSFAISTYNQKSPEASVILIRRCQEVAENREHENEDMHTTNIDVPATPSRPA